MPVVFSYICIELGIKLTSSLCLYIPKYTLDPINTDLNFWCHQKIVLTINRVSELEPKNVFLCN